MDPIHPTTDNKASIALLRRARAGERVPFVHDVDVCDAVPEVLVADLHPVPGTCHDDDGGYSSVWYCYCAKKYKNTRGKLSGYRQRAVNGSGGASWHSEISRKEVQGSGGGTFCTLSYGRKPNPSSNSIDRMGWCMVEYDLKQQDDATNSNYVLCKVYRSSRAKGKSASSASASASTSSSKNAASSKKMAKKRKATGGGEHPEAPPAKMIQRQEEQEPEEVQQELPAYCYQLPAGVDESDDHGGEFLSDFNIDDINFYVSDESMVQGAMPEPGVQTVGDMLGRAESEHQDFLNMEEEFTLEWLLRGQPQQQQPMIMEPLPQPGHGGDEFIQMLCGPVVPAVPEAMFEEMLGPGPPETTTFSDCSGGGGMATAAAASTDDPHLFVAAAAEKGGGDGEFIQMPCGPAVPAVPEATLEEMLGLGQETTTAMMYGQQWSGGMATASIPCPWSRGYNAATMNSSSYSPCSGLLLHQGPDRSLLQLPYLMC